MQTVITYITLLFSSLVLQGQNTVQVSEETFNFKSDAVIVNLYTLDSKYSTEYEIVKYETLNYRCYFDE